MESGQNKLEVLYSPTEDMVGRCVYKAFGNIDINVWQRV